MVGNKPVVYKSAIAVATVNVYTHFGGSVHQQPQFMSGLTMMSKNPGSRDELAGFMACSTSRLQRLHGSQDQ